MAVYVRQGKVVIDEVIDDASDKLLNAFLFSGVALGDIVVVDAPSEEVAGELIGAGIAFPLPSRFNGRFVPLTFAPVIVFFVSARRISTGSEAACDESRNAGNSLQPMHEIEVLLRDPFGFGILSRGILKTYCTDVKRRPQAVVVVVCHVPRREV